MPVIEKLKAFIQKVFLIKKERDDLKQERAEIEKILDETIAELEK